MEFDDFEDDNSQENEIQYELTSAGWLYALPLPPEVKTRIVNSLVNEAMAARNLLQLTPSGDGRVMIGYPEDVGTAGFGKDVNKYGHCVETTNEAFSGTGFSIEMLRK